MLTLVEWWERVKERRKALGLTGRALSGAAGVSPQRISDIEAGRYQNPELDTLQRLAAALNTSVAFLVDGVTSPVTDDVLQLGTPKTQSSQSSEGSVHAEAATIRSSPEAFDPIGIATDIYKHTTALSALADTLLRQYGPRLDSQGAPAGSVSDEGAPGFYGRTRRGQGR